MEDKVKEEGGEEEVTRDNQIVIIQELVIPC